MLFPDAVSKLSDLKPGAVGDAFALLCSKKADVTKGGKPFFKCAFRDAAREVAVMVWSDSGHYADCEKSWKKGTFYKLRGKYEDGNFGPQLNLDRIRPVNDDDRAAGFKEADFYPGTAFDPEQMFRALVSLCEENIEDGPLRSVVLKILEGREADVKRWPAASRNHHAYAGGFLEHTLSVARTVVWLCEKYAGMYPEMDPPLCSDAAVAGAVLHDVGKLEELDGNPAGSDYTPTGRLLGHILIGRDWLRGAAADLAAAGTPVDAELLLRAEHVVVAHHGTREFGSPAEPLTPEALIVAAADDLDAKYRMFADGLASAAGPAPADGGPAFAPRHKLLRKEFFRGLPADPG